MSYTTVKFINKNIDKKVQMMNYKLIYNYKIEMIRKKRHLRLIVIELEGENTLYINF